MSYTEPSPPEPPERQSHDIFGPLEQSGALRGVMLVFVALVVGILLMPSATRASLSVSSAPAAAPLSSGSSTTTLPVTINDTTSTTTSPAHASYSSIKVLVANGTHTNGAAAAVSAFLAGKTFSMLTPIDATTTVSASQVYAVNGAVAAAHTVASVLGLPSSSIEPSYQPVPVASVGNAQVVVIVGPDLQSSPSSTSSG